MDFTANLSGKTIFSKVDLLKGYHQIPVAENDIGKTAVITPFGLFIFPRCPFGLKNAGQDFQRMMDAILGDLPFCYVYLDDILVFSNSPEEHMSHLKQIFDLLAENGLVVNRAKCVLGVSELDFLGFHVNKDGIVPLPDKVEAIRATKTPTTVKELQRFLGMVGYYRRNIKSASQHLDFLFEALENKPKKLTWNPDRETSFQSIKEALAKSALLHHPRPNATLALTTDASKVAVGGVLEQRGPRGWEPLAFLQRSPQRQTTGMASFRPRTARCTPRNPPLQTHARRTPLHPLYGSPILNPGAFQKNRTPHSETNLPALEHRGVYNRHSLPTRQS